MEFERATLHTGCFGSCFKRHLEILSSSKSVIKKDTGFVPLGHFRAPDEHAEKEALTLMTLPYPCHGGFMMLLTIMAAMPYIASFFGH